MKRVYKKIINNPWSILGFALICYIVIHVVLKKESTDPLMAGLKTLIIYGLYAFTAIPVVFLLIFLGGLATEHIPENFRFKYKFRYLNYVLYGAITLLIWFLGPALLWLAGEYLFTKLF